jgi:hypothetical protein
MAFLARKTMVGVLTLTLGACSAEESSQASAGESATEGDETQGAACEHDVVDDCCCFYEELEYYVRTACAFEPLCGSFSVQCPMGPTDCPAETASISDEAELECALQALAQGSSGLVSYRVVHTGDTGAVPVYDTRYLYLRGDGTAFLATESLADSPAAHGGAQLVQLAEASTLAQCSTLDDTSAKIGCLFDAVTSELETCLPPQG